MQGERGMVGEGTLGMGKGDLGGGETSEMQLATSACVVRNAVF